MNGPLEVFFEVAEADLLELIDRRFGGRRTLTVEPDGAKWAAAIDNKILYRSPDRNAVVRFALTFQQRTAGIDIRYVDGHSMRVPSNVVPIREGVA